MINVVLLLKIFFKRLNILLLDPYVRLRHAPVEVGSEVVGAMTCVLGAIDEVAVGQQLKRKLYKRST